MSYNQKVLSHLQNFWINHEIKRFSWALGRIIEELPDFQVFQVIPNHEDEPWVYVSSGIGQFLGQEFFIISPFKHLNILRPWQCWHLQVCITLINFNWEKR